MAQLNRWSFRGVPLNRTNVRIRQMTGQFGLPPLRGNDFLTFNRTGQLFIPKIHDSRRIGLEIIITDEPAWVAQSIFDELGALFADRAQGALINHLATGDRTGQAEAVTWLPGDTSNVGVVFKGVVDFLLADPWLYGPTISGNVVPNAGLAFGTPVVSNISGPQTTWAAALTGVISGQPILVVHATQGYNTVLTSIADTFSTPYTYVKVDGNNTTQDLEIYIGTGGVGTSGTVTVTAPSGLIGGLVIPMQGASTAAGLSAINTNGNSNGAASPPSLSLTPTAVGEGALYAFLTDSPYSPAPTFPVPNISTAILYSGGAVGRVGQYLYPANGVALAVAGVGNLPHWESAGAIIKGSGAPVTLSLSNPGTVTAEKIVIDCLGPIASPTIANTTNGTSVTINTNVSGTKHLIVDTGAFTALNDGANVIGNLTHSGAVPFLTLAPGPNVLQISGAACTGSTLVTVSFAPGYE